MRVALLNTFWEGGSAVLMRRLYKGLQAGGHEARMYTKTGAAHLGAESIGSGSGRFNSLKSRIFGRFERGTMRSGVPSYFGRLKQPIKTSLPKGFVPDVVHLHWIGHWIDLPSLIESIPVRTPIIWTIHDMSPLAGGCFTDFDCNQFGNGCRKCPLLKPPFNRFYARTELARRKRELGKRKVFAVGNSAFTTGLIKKSEVFVDSRVTETVHPAVDSTEMFFSPRARAELRSRAKNIVLGFGAASLTDENKGIDRFFKVAELVAQRLGPIEVKIFGEGAIAANIKNVTVRNLGMLRTPDALRDAYSSIDILVITSRMETFGQVSIEAQACGTPVWGFAVGGLPDTVKENITGRLVNYPDVQAMATSICDSVDRLAEMGENAKEWVAESFSIKTMTGKYERIYRAAVSG